MDYVVLGCASLSPPPALLTDDHWNTLTVTFYEQPMGTHGVIDGVGCVWQGMGRRPLWQK